MNPTRPIRRPRTNDPEPTFWTGEEVRRILSVPMQPRDHVLLETLARTAQRSGPVRRLQWKNVRLDLTEPVIQFPLGKGGKTHTLPMDKELIHDFTVYKRLIHPEPDDYVFQSRNRHTRGANPTGLNGPISAQQCNRIIEQTVYLGSDGPAELRPVQSTLERLAGASGSAASMSPTNRRKNEYLTHGLHKYKAKFFPRMARALLNFTAPPGSTVLDPFVGSGTLTLEASLMGLASYGVDVDPLSVRISDLKIESLSLPTAEFDDAVNTVTRRLEADGQTSLLWDVDVDSADEPFALPAFIGSKMSDEADEVEVQVGRARSAILGLGEHPAAPLVQLALSHALATKISLRWMGTGDNRFALALAKRTLIQIFLTHLAKIRMGLVQRDEAVRLGIVTPAELGAANLEEGDARSTRFGTETFDAVITSPPYLPA